MIDITLAKIIAKVEDMGAGPRSVRFEETVYQRLGDSPSNAEAAILVMIGNLHKCSHHTARMIAASSWGNYQMMGLSLYELGWASDVFAFIADAVKQADMFDQFLIHHAINFTWADLLADAEKRDLFVSRYNGPDAIDAYWGACIAAAKALKLPIA